MAAEFYGPGARRLQDELDTRRLADRVKRLAHDTISDDDRAFIERIDMFFLATVDEEGRPNCSYKGGEPGFLKVLDPRTIAFPSYDGNGMFLSLGNIATTHEVGLLFIDFIGQTRVRLNGRASVDTADPLLAECFPEADCVVRVEVREVFPNCPRYIHKMQLVERSRFVPHVGCETPVPAWKKFDWAADALPEGDPARDPKREVISR
jgi:predicted pyridoxine 5'-phosphate oxidase superfamily flavin-nucleotide-binding protein